MIKKLLAALLCLSFVSILSIGVVGCGEKKDPAKKEAAEKKDPDPKKT